MNNMNQNQFNVNLESYEGPIDLLLDLAKNQKVDLSKISVLKLAEQYLSYINIAKQINLEIVSDYLVMAAWLTYLKSRFLLPKKIDTDEPTTEELEEAVKFQLKRLEAMQNVSKELFNLPQVGTNVFYTGSSHGARFKYETQYTSSLFDLFTSYAKQISKTDTNQLKIKMSELYSVENAIERLKLTFLHVFPFSSRPGTAAAKMPQTPSNIIKERAKILRDHGNEQLKKELKKS